MSRLIDADHLKSMLQEYIKREQAYIDIGNNTRIAIAHSNGLWEAIAQIDEEPTIEPRKGKWIYQNGLGWGETWICSECGEKTTSTIMGKPRYKWCPMCGVEMRGGEDDLLEG